MSLIISEEEAKARLGNPENLANKGYRIQDEFAKQSDLQDSYNKQRPNGPNNDADQAVSIRPTNNGGRREGDTNVPDVIRATAALLAQNGEPTKDIAQALGISKTSVDQYKEGNTSFGRPSKELRAVLRQNLDEIQEKAIKKMLKGVDFMDFDNEAKMQKVSYRDMSNILVNMAKLVDAKVGTEDGEREMTKLIVYAPTIRTEQHFQTLEVRETIGVS